MRDERRLARRAARGDRDAFTAIFRRFQQDLYRYCVAILGNPDDAQDALQNTMVKALGALPGERREIDLKPWLYRIAHNESIDLIRRRRPTVSLEEEGPATGPGLAQEVETRQRLRQLIADVGDLPERQRGALLMREAGGLEFEEIATALGTSPAVARQTLYEARLGLREMDAGRNMECTAVTKALSDGDRRVRRRRDISAHLKACAGCRLFAEEIDTRRHALASITPLPAVAAAALLHGLGGGGGYGAAIGSGTTGVAGTSTAGGIGGAVGAGATKTIGVATLLKSAATIAAAAAIGVGGADVGDLIQTPTDGATAKAQTEPGEDPGQAGDRRMGGADPESAGRAVPFRFAAGSGTDRPRSDKERPDALPHPPSAFTAASDHVAAPVAEDRSVRTPAAAAQEGTAPTAAPEKSAVEPPDGTDPPIGLPAEDAHGQETGAAATEKGKSASAPGHAEASAGATDPAASDHPTHPEHPAKPSHPEPVAPPPSSGVTSTDAEAEATAEEATGEGESPVAEGGPPGQTRTPPGQAKKEGE